MLISADLFCCGLITLIQTLGATRWFGIQLLRHDGRHLASVAPMAAMATAELAGRERSCSAPSSARAWCPS